MEGFSCLFQDLNLTRGRKKKHQLEEEKCVKGAPWPQPQQHKVYAIKTNEGIELNKTNK